MIGMDITDWLDSLSFVQRQRLQFIEAKLLWEGSVQRSDVCKVFDVTPNHLTRDIKRYRNFRKDALEYDVESRAYKRGRKFKPLVASGSAEEYLALLQAYNVSNSTSVISAIGHIANSECVGAPKGTVDPEVLRLMIVALRDGTGISVTYQSFSDENPSPRILWPHTLVFNGDRWHVRAFDEKRKAFRDFVLARCMSPKHWPASCPVVVEADKAWHETELVEVIPAPRLSETQKAVVAREFGMEKDERGQWRWSSLIRKSLVAYLLYRYRMDKGGSSDKKITPGQHPYLALRNPDLAKQYNFDND
jgi:predicted DNA-binding transcriptional regulator YafY